MIAKISTVLSGTVLAQAIGLFMMPVISRMYSPDAFGEFQVTASVIAVLLPLAALRMEYVILRLKSTEALSGLIYLCVLINSFIAAILYLCVSVIVPLLMPAAAEEVWASWLLPIAFLAAGVLQTASLLPVRTSQHRLIAVSKVTQASVFSLGSVVGGALAPVASAAFLVLSDILSRMLGAVIVLRNSLTFRAAVMPSRIGMLRLWRAYRRYPAYSVPSSLIGALTAAFPVFWLSANIGRDAVGQFGMAWRTGFVPLTMLTFAVSQVVSAELSTHVRAGGYGARQFLVRAVTGVLVLGVVPVVGVSLAAEWMFPWALGPDWTEAGRMLRAMGPLLLNTLITGPIAMALVIAGRPDIHLRWELSRLAVLLVAFYVNSRSAQSPIVAVNLYSICVFLMGLIYFAIVVRVVERREAVTSAAGRS